MSEDCCQLFKNLCQPESMKFYRARSYTCHEFFSLCSVKSKCTCICISIYFDLCSMKLQYIKVTQFSQIIRKIVMPKASQPVQYQLFSNTEFSVNFVTLWSKQCSQEHQNDKNSKSYKIYNFPFLSDTTYFTQYYGGSARAILSFLARACSKQGNGEGWERKVVRGRLEGES